MTHKLRISDSLSLPPATVTSTLIVYGGKGMGKTNFGAVLIEEMSRAGLRWSVLDPMGVWYGIRHAHDGKGKGIECLILGGAHGDIPIEPTGGSVAADLVVDEDTNVIIDFSRKPNGETWGVGEKIRFITEYGRRLFQRQGSLVNGKRREPIFQVLDEAARFIPQMIRAGQPELAQCLSVWAQMVEEGRNFGLGVCLLTQRSARLNKDVAELADAMIAFRTVGPNSIGAVMDWLGEHVPKQRIHELIEQLRSLPVGRCMVVSPGWLEVEKIVQIRERETFDSSATPRPGESVKRVTGEAAKPDLVKYAARMQETIERVKQNDPAELKRKLAAVMKELEQERKKETPSAVAGKQGKIERVDRGELEKAMQAEIDRIMTSQIRPQLRRGIGGNLESLMGRLEATIEVLRQNIACLDDGPHWKMNFLSRDAKRNLNRTIATVPQPDPQPIQRMLAAPVQRRTENPRGENSGNLSRPQLALIAALAEAEAIGRTQISRTWMAFLARVSSKSSGFEKNVSTLRTAGMIDYPGSNLVMLTDKGRGIAPAVDQPLGPNELFMRIATVVSGPQAELLKVLRENYPKSLTREELAELARVSPLSSGFEKNVSTLSSRELVSYPTQGMVRLEDWVMLQEAAA